MGAVGRSGILRIMSRGIRAAGAETSLFRMRVRTAGTDGWK
nr:MAG TPA: hypothetical protein [Caudoviricetes sp.]DAK54016.1 MAG TPA: hypothetical protein [Caudoviricetes sp.]